MKSCEHGKGFLRWLLRCFACNKIGNFRLSLGLRINCHNDNIVFGMIVVIGKFKNLEKSHCNAHVSLGKLLLAETLEICFFSADLGWEMVLIFVYLQLGMMKLITALVTLCRDLSVLFMYQ